MKTNALTDLIVKIKEKLKPTDVAAMLGFTPKGGMILCPYHDDRSPSMSCHDESGSFKCFSPACSKHERGIDIVSFYQDQKEASFPEAVEALASRAGLEMPSSRPSRKSSIFPSVDSVINHLKTKMPGYQFERSHLWLDRTGRQNKIVLVFRDFEGRKQCPQAFFHNSSWCLSKPQGHKPHVPYHWDRIKDSPMIIICEGEKDVETLSELGFPATTTGSSSSWKTEHTTFFKGKDVVIFPDKDEPGAKYAQAILADLRPIVRSIKVIEIPGDEGTDVTDFVKRTETAQQSLQSLMDVSQDIKHVWEAPRLNLKQLERIPIFVPEEMLPESLRYWLEYLADDLQAPIDALAAPALAALSILVGRKLFLQPKEHSREFTVPAALWCMLIAESGQKKTQIFKKALQPLMQIDDRLQKENARIIAELEGAMTRIRIQEREHEAQLTEAIRKQQGNLIAAHERRLSQLHMEKEALRKKGAKYVFISDATGERIMEILASNPDGSMVFVDELPGWWRSLSKGLLDLRKLFLESWGGIRINVERKSYRLKGESILSVVGGVQPDWLSHILDDIQKGGKENDGLINRFGLLINHDRSIEHWQYVDRKPVEQAYELYEGLFEEFYRFKTSDIIPDWREGDSKAIPFSDDARAIFVPWLVEKENSIRDNDYPPVLASHYSKYTSLFCSLALIFHLILVFEEVTTDKWRVSKHAAELAKRWCDYLALHAHKTFSRSDSYYDPAVRSFANKIRSGDIIDGMTRRDIQNSGFPHLKSPKKLDRALEELCRLNVIKLEDSLERSNGSKVIRINPEVRA